MVGRPVFPHPKKTMTFTAPERWPGDDPVTIRHLLSGFGFYKPVSDNEEADLFVKLPGNGHHGIVQVRTVPVCR